MALNYLTVQDVLYINFELTGAKQPFDYARLEEAVNYQYASGQSSDIVAQAARFVRGFVKMAPFTTGNEASAFVALMVFLEANGKTLDLTEDDAADWCQSVWSSAVGAREAVQSCLKEAHLDVEHGVPNVREITESAIERYALALADLQVETARA